MEQELKNTLKTVQLQIRFPEEIDIESILNKKKRFRAKQAVIFVALMVLFLLLVPNVTPSWAGLKLFGTSDQPPHPYSEYLVHDAHYYIPTNERVSKEQLSSKLGTISRIAKQVGKPDVKSIFGGKNDPSEVQAAYQNIRREVRFLRILQSPELERTSIALRNDGSRYHVQLEYRLPPKAAWGRRSQYLVMTIPLKNLFGYKNIQKDIKTGTILITMVIFNMTPTTKLENLFPMA